MPGGNHKSYELDGLEFDVGSIYFHARDGHFDILPELREGCTVLKVQHAKLGPGGVLSRFPYDFRKDLAGWRKFALPMSFGEAYARRALYRTHEDVDSYLRARLGSFLYAQSGLSAYLTRLFGAPPSEIDSAFALSRLGWINRRSSLRYQLRRQLGLDPRLAPSNKTLVRRPGGFAAYYERAVKALEGEGVEIRLATKVRRIESDGAVKRVHLDEETVTARRIISTIPIPKAAELVGADVPALEHVVLHSLFVEAQAPLATPATVVYNFDAVGAWKRLTVHSHMYGPATRTAFTVEIPVAPRRKALPHEAAFEAFANHVRRRGLACSDLRLVGSSTLDCAYPFLSKGYNERRSAAMAALSAAGIESLGRQGRFDYVPSSAVAANGVKTFIAGAANGQTPASPHAVESAKPADPVTPHEGIGAPPLRSQEGQSQKGQSQGAPRGDLNARS